MSNYIKLMVPLRQDAYWFKRLREAMAAKDILVNWQNGGYHITMAFFNSNEQVKALNDAFNKCINERLAPSLTLDKVDVFKAQHKPEYIVHLTSSQPSPRFVDFVDLLRHEASNLGAEIESEFKLHITLGKIDTSSTTLEEVKKAVDGIQVPPFTLRLTDAEYLYHKGHSIGSWKMEGNSRQSKHQVLR